MAWKRPVKLSAVLLLVSTILAGCAGLLGTRKPLPPRSPQILARDLDQHRQRLETFWGMADFNAYSSEGAFRGTLTLAVKMPDSLFLKIEGPLGIDLITARFGGNQVILYSPWEKLAYKGSVQRIMDLHLLPLEMGSYDLVLSMLGLWELDAGQLSALDSLSTQSRRYVMTFHTGDTVWLEPEGPVITRWEMREYDGELLWVWEGKEYAKKKGIRVPRLVRMTTSEPRQQVTLFYRRMKINKPLDYNWCRISIPEGVKTIDLQDESAE
jgi:hypothetical protein